MSDIEEISRNVEADRARLAQSLDNLTDTFQPQNLAQEATRAANEICSDLARKAMGTLQNNPAGGLLVTLGLGLMATRSQPQPRPAAPQQTTAVEPDQAFHGLDDRIAEADAQIRAELAGEMAPRPEASKLKAAVNAGLDQLPKSARKRVVKAREAAIAAQEKVERQAARAARQTKGFIHEQPLTAGALAVGFGVLAASLLPRTRREDEMLGKQRDALMAEARNSLEEEMSKIRHKAENALPPKSQKALQDSHL